MSIDKEIVEEFVGESKKLIHDLVEILESAEGDFSQVQKLEDYGNMVDRIMGGAKSVAMGADKDHAAHVVADYAALCKAVGYKASQIRDNEQFFDICVALLLDATETLDILLDRIHEPASEITKTVPSQFIDRLNWVSSQFKAGFRESVDGTSDAAKQMSQDDIDALMKKLGF